jgi:hypothetical protein
MESPWAKEVSISVPTHSEQFRELVNQQEGQVEVSQERATYTASSVTFRESAICSLGGLGWQKG